VLVFGLPLIWLVVFPLAAISFGELEGDWEATMINYLCCFGSFLAHVMKRGYQIAGPRAEGLACQRPFWRQAKGG
jgi:hypothetical protein